MRAEHHAQRKALLLRFLANRNEAVGRWMFPEIYVLVKFCVSANPAALSLDSAKGDLYLADRDNNQIWMVRDYAGAATPMLFVDSRAGVSSPVGIRVSADGRRLLIANSGTRGHRRP